MTRPRGIVLLFSLGFAIALVVPPAARASTGSIGAQQSTSAAAIPTRSKCYDSGCADCHQG